MTVFNPHYGGKESSDFMAQDLAHSKECSDGCHEPTNHLDSKASVQLQDGRHHALALSTELCLATPSQPPDHFSQAPAGMLILFFFWTVMFRLQNKKNGMKTSLGNLRPLFATQNVPAQSQRKGFMCLWELVFIFGSYCHQALTVKNRIKVFSIRHNRLQLLKALKKMFSLPYSGCYQL